MRVPSDLDTHLEQLQSFNPLADTVSGEERGHRFVDGSAPGEADCQFRLFIYTDEEPQTAARLLADPNKYFWYQAFGEAVFPTIEEAYGTFVEGVREIIFPLRVSRRERSCSFGISSSRSAQALTILIFDRSQPPLLVVQTHWVCEYSQELRCSC